MRVKLWFSGNPIPKHRVRGSHGAYYTPEPTREWEDTVGWQARSQWKQEPLEGDLGIEFIFFRENKRRVDISNLVKSMEDALQGIVFLDDSQIKRIKMHLRYSKERPGVEVEIWTL